MNNVRSGAGGERIDKVLSNSFSFLGFSRSSKYQQSQAGWMNIFCILEPRQGLKSFTVSSIWKFFKVVASYGVKSVEIFGYFETQ